MIFIKTRGYGEYDHEGYLTITGRVKDQFKTDKGQIHIPAPIRTSKFQRIRPNIGTDLVVGNRYNLSLLR